MAITPVPLQNVVETLNKLLTPENYSDMTWNGVQVEAKKQEISRVGLAVDAGLSVLKRAVEESCDLLITHHGLFWEGDSPIVTGLTGEKVQVLLGGNCSLYVSHLPLDGNLAVGNAALLAKSIDLTDISPAFEYKGATLGVIGQLAAPIAKEELEKLVYSRVIPSGQDGIKCALLFGSDRIESIGVATGSASSLISEAKSLGCDAFISGEPKQEAYHTAKEEQLNVIFAGHYFTETYGVQAVGKYLEEHLKISTVFLDEPTGI